MPKMKTHRAAAKRFRTTKSGKVTRHQAGAAHLFTAKTRKRKRQLRKGTLVAASDVRRVKRLIPYL